MGALEVGVKALSISWCGLNDNWGLWFLVVLVCGGGGDGDISN